MKAAQAFVARSTHGATILSEMGVIADNDDAQRCRTDQWRRSLHDGGGGAGGGTVFFQVVVVTNAATPRRAPSHCWWLQPVVMRGAKTKTPLPRPPRVAGHRRNKYSAVVHRDDGGLFDRAPRGRLTTALSRAVRGPTTPRGPRSRCNFNAWRPRFDVFARDCYSSQGLVTRSAPLAARRQQL